MLPDFSLYSLRQLVILRLQFAIARLFPTFALPLNFIPVLRQPDGLGIIYKSAIAFKLTTLCQETLTKIATRLVADLSNHTSDFPLELTVEFVSPGWIYFRYSELEIARWLQSAIDLEIRSKAAKRNLSSSIMPLQYAHARCCSILRLGQTQGLIDIDLHGEKLWLAPQPIVWFGKQYRWYLTDSHAVRAIASLVDLVDATQVSEVNLLKSATSLAGYLLDFESNCRFIQTKSDLVLSRLALVAAVKSGLRLVLENKFDTVALTEL
jgi:arginyl-tRNA synthetase